MKGVGPIVPMAGVEGGTHWALRPPRRRRGRQSPHGHNGPHPSHLFTFLSFVTPLTFYCFVLDSSQILYLFSD